MKRKSVVFSLALLLAFLLPLGANADTGTSEQALTLAVNGSALIRVDPGSNGSTSVSLSLAGAANAGEAVDLVSTNNKTRLKISSLASSPTDKRKITASNTGTSLTSSVTQLSMRLTDPNSNFVNYSSDGLGEGGALVTSGTDAGYIIISNSAGNSAAQDLVKTIGTCWSGTAADDGYVIDYKYMKTGTGSASGRTGVVITFTIVADV